MRPAHKWRPRARLGTITRHGRVIPFAFHMLILTSYIAVFACLTVPSAEVQDSVAAPSNVTRIAFGSCLHEGQPMPIWNAVHAANPDVFVFLGDNIYGDSEDPDVLRAKYAMLQADAGVQRVFANTYTLGTWDDHDFGANDAGVEYPSKVASQDLFLNFLRVPKDSPRRQRAGVYHAEVLGEPGRRVQFLMLDTRYHRSPIDPFAERPRGRGPYGPTADLTRTMLGEHIWGPRFSHDTKSQNLINVHIGNLRRKISKVSTSVSIKPVRDFGYKLTATNKE